MPNELTLIDFYYSFEIQRNKPLIKIEIDT